MKKILQFFNTKGNSTQKENGKTSSISKSVLKIVILILIITVAVTSTVSLFYLNDLVVNISQDKAAATSNMAENELKRIKDDLEASAAKVAKDSNIINSVIDKDLSDVQDEINNLKENENLQLDNITISDNKGIVAASLNSTLKIGDNISNNNCIKSSLGGNVSSEIGKEGSQFFQIVASAPMLDEDNNVLGVVSTSYNLEDTEFVDNLKTVINNEITIFEGDKRVNSTIMENGKRIIGTKLDSKIADIVINQKKEYIGKTSLFGKTYITVYRPITDLNGVVDGVIFTGSDYSKVQTQIIFTVILIAAVSILAIIISIIVVMKFLRKRLKRPLDKVVNAAKSIENGEINDEVIEQLKSISTKDEIGALARSVEGALGSIQMIAEDVEKYKDAINDHDLTYSADVEKHKGMYRIIVEIVGELFSEISTILKGIKEAADGIDAGSDQVSASSQMLAQGATEQASSTEELAATISDIAEHIRNDAEKADNAIVLSDETTKEVSLSSEFMNEMMSSIGEINRTSKEIDKIIKTIDDIAFQTNILALNAAVEAARAGAAGKGFAVVADEVRNLATKSAEAAKSTTLLIESSSVAVDKGYKIANDTMQALRIVVEKTDEVNLIINEIAEASKNQSEGINQVNIGVEQISSVVQTNSASAEEIAASSEELAGQADMLKKMVEKYKL